MYEYMSVEIKVACYRHAQARDDFQFQRLYHPSSS
jgi:hypothetical protein